jgi:hypothetical protein
MLGERDSTGFMLGERDSTGVDHFRFIQKKVDSLKGEILDEIYLGVLGDELAITSFILV